jgi:hypothetical protein
MSRYNKYLVAIIVLSALGCNQKKSFSDPYPIQANILTRFPKNLQGEYLNPISKSNLLIGDKTIAINFNFDLKLPFDQQIYSSYNKEDSTAKENYIKREGDSLIIRKIMFTDTLFVLNQETILKTINGVYFLNKRTKNFKWDVYKLEFKHNNLLIRKIIPEHPADRFIKISKTKKDTVLLFSFSPADRFNNTSTKTDIIQAEVFSKIK